jgi:hypothetical protein
MTEEVDSGAVPGEGKAAARAARETGTPREHLDPKVVQRDFEQDIALKKTYARWLLVAMSVQIGFANLGFFCYGIANEWRIEPVVMQFWLSAAVVQVIGIVYVIARYLFPRRDH